MDIVAVELVSHNQNRGVGNRAEEGKLCAESAVLSDVTLYQVYDELHSCDTEHDKRSHKEGQVDVDRLKWVVNDLHIRVGLSGPSPAKADPEPSKPEESCFRVDSSGHSLELIKLVNHEGASPENGCGSLCRHVLGRHNSNTLQRRILRLSVTLPVHDEDVRVTLLADT
jgi:hypothetical protein